MVVSKQFLSCDDGIKHFQSLGSYLQEHVTGLEAVFSSKKLGTIMNEDLKPHHTLSMQRDFSVNMRIFSDPDSAVTLVYNTIQLEINLTAPQNLPRPGIIYSPFVKGT